ncbi:hypothetical protein GCK72_010032 [Caenorhabditis remanei]|uniref:Maelstrom domain-containing protein n=1 Tax=Caenorhabditis remanei TaxID=31234 RepID=A0A6A5H4J4_CAERE|nr:hypothetical protein GCK72_010032 [Caenorhabditis remanei]KAF1761776.1 hypothetical protein GCK72_010032 [Caenorhabditis remanei]
MRKQNRPNQTARKQMQNLTVELFARDKNARRQLIDEALSVSSTIPVNDISPSKTPEQPAISPTPEPIQELVQVLLAPEPGNHVPRKPRSPRKSAPAKPKTVPKISQPNPVQQTEKSEQQDKPKVVQKSENGTTVKPQDSLTPVSNPDSSKVVVDELQQAEKRKQHVESAEKTEPKAIAEVSVSETLPVTDPVSPAVPSAQSPVEDEEPFVPPPPLQRVPYEAQSSHLANIRAVTESMNIAAFPSQSQLSQQQHQHHQQHQQQHQHQYQQQQPQQQQQQQQQQLQEPMSFAACVRKQPSIESMSVSPSPYSKFDGKTSPFNTGGNMGGFSNQGGFGGFSREPNKNPNPFANRKRFNYDYDSPSNNSHSHSNNRFFPDRSDQVRDLSDGFSALSSKPNGFMNRGMSRESSSSGVLPNWYKGRSFSTASSHYPYSQRSTSSGQFSPFTKTSHSTTLNIPSHGHVEDIDGFLASSTPSNPFFSKRSDLNMKKERWARMKAKKRMLRRPIEDEFYEDPDIEEEILCGNGVMLNQIVQQSSSGNYEDADLLRKYRRDVAFVKERVLNSIDGNIDGIRDLRFLLASVQTYGNIDGECMMAELGMNEFSLFSGIIEKFHAIIGPWQTENESQRRRASRHALETHRIPLQHSIATISKRKLVEEILGRVEPSIACHQGVKVGLYSDSCNEKTRIELNIKNNFKDPGMICDKNDRRFILVLQSELDLMVESMKHLAKTVGFHYDGFPVHHNCFVIVEAFVEAISDIMNEKIDLETMRWFSLLGQKVDAEESASPWETGTNFHCARHSEPKSNFCAAVTVGRTCIIIYHVLGSFFRRYHLKKIPTALQIPSTSAPIQ